MSHRAARGRNIKRDYRAFTIRLPQKLYDELQAEANSHRRSVAAQVELDLEGKYL